MHQNPLPHESVQGNHAWSCEQGYYEVPAPVTKEELAAAEQPADPTPSDDSGTPPTSSATDGSESSEPETVDAVPEETAPAATPETETVENAYQAMPDVHPGDLDTLKLGDAPSAAEPTELEPVADLVALPSSVDLDTVADETKAAHETLGEKIEHAAHEAVDGLGTALGTALGEAKFGE